MPPAPAPASGRTPRIALICDDDAAGEAVTTFIADLGLEPVIGQEPQPDGSLEVLEALRQADFAVVLQSDRQFEIGFLLAALGRAKMVLLQPAEAGGLRGIPRQEMDEGGLWRLLLAREMKKAGLEIDLNRAL